MQLTPRLLLFSSLAFSASHAATITEFLASNNEGLVSSDLGENHLAISYQQNINATDIDSPVLVDELTNAAAQTKQVIQRLADSVTTTPRRFLKVRVHR